MEILLWENFNLKFTRYKKIEDCEIRINNDISLDIFVKGKLDIKLEMRESRFFDAESNRILVIES